MDINKLVLEATKTNWKFGQILSNIVRDKITETKKKMNVHFDLENNEPVGDKRIIKCYRHDSPSGDEIHNRYMCQMYKAGGDWEYPVAYFVCQIIDGFINNEQYRHISRYGGEKSFFCFIPLSDNALYKHDGKYYAYSDSDHKKEEVSEIKDRSCWKQLTEFLQKISIREETNGNTTAIGNG